MLETLSLEYFVRTIAAILFVAALLFLVVWALKVRFKGKHSEKGGEIQVVQKMQIDTKHSITALPAHGIGVALLLRSIQIG